MIDQFLDSLRGRGLKPATIDQYRQHLSQFDRWLFRKNLSFFTAEPDDITHYYAAVSKEPHSSSTIYKKSHAVFALYRWLVDQGFLLVSPTPPPIPFKGGALPREVPKTHEIKEIIDAFNTLTNPTDQKTALMVDLFYSCGIRREELNRLNTSDVDFQNGTVRVFGKGDRERIVPVGDHTMKRIWFYLIDIRGRIAPECRTKALFISWQENGKRMHVGSISAMIAKFRKRFGMAKTITPHALRHAFAVDLLKDGAAVQDISEMLGHQKLETTQIYTRLVPKELKGQHQMYHPRG